MMPTRAQPKTTKAILLILAILATAAVATKHHQKAEAERAAAELAKTKAEQSARAEAAKREAEAAERAKEEKEAREHEEAEARAATAAAIERHAIADTRAKLTTLGRRWVDASTLAGQSPRLALPTIFAELQALKRDAEALSPHPCGAAAKESLLRAMSSEIDAYTIFMRDATTGIVYFRAPHEKALSEWARFKQNIATCSDN